VIDAVHCVYPSYALGETKMPPTKKQELMVEQMIQKILSHCLMTNMSSNTKIIMIFLDGLKDVGGN
jgi:hypothetical protein